MILRTWDGLPGTLVLQAIDEILSRSEELDKTQGNIRIGISTDKGDAFFDSQYEAWLFQLMPILERLEPERGDTLLRKNSAVRTALEEYPQGLRSMSYGGKGLVSKPNTFESMSFVGQENRTEAVAMQMNDQIVRREREIVTETTANPKQALSDAMALPLNHPLVPELCPRAATLHEVAVNAATKDPAVCRAAVQELRRLLDCIALSTQARLLADLPEVLLRIGDENEARDSLDTLLAIAAKLYKRDVNPSDPNQAFKGMWPSVNLWRRCMEFAAKLTPSPADQIIEDIPDAEIKLIERVALATSLIGVPLQQLSVIEHYRETSNAVIVP